MYLLFMTFAITAKLSKPFSAQGLSKEEIEKLQFERSIAIGLLAASTSLAVSGLFEFNFGTGHVRLTYFYWLAFLTVTNCRKTQSIRNHEKLRRAHHVGAIKHGYHRK